MPMRAADDVGLGERRVEDAVVAVEPLQAVRQLEHAALARTSGSASSLADVRHVLAEDDDARVARHLVLQGAVDRRDHRVGLAFGLRAASRMPPTSDRRRANRPTASAVSFGPASARAAPRRAASLTSRSTSRAHRRQLVVGHEPVASSGTPRTAGSDRAAPPPRAPPASCTAARRRTASASTAGSPARARTPDPCARGT